MSDAEQNKRYVILGFPRSGTTLLSRLLSGNPGISAPPETGLLSGAGRFLKELTTVEGPSIGVLTGLAFAGIQAETIYASLRNLVFDLQKTIAGPRSIWVEKTGTDVFHLEVLEPMLVGHVRFICITRNPLDVIASNIDLARTMGSQLPELFALTQGTNPEHDGYAKAWVDRQNALDDFVGRNKADCFSIRYEDLLSDPIDSLTKLLSFMELKQDPQKMIEEAFKDDAPIGLGDFRINETHGLATPVKDGWRKRLPRVAVSRIVPVVAELMQRHGYTVPRIPSGLSREDAVRQFEMAARMKRQVPSSS
jgi:hypothetical protein